MSAKVDFYFDVVCPYAYLAHTQVERVCAGAELSWKPILLGGLFRVIGAGDGPMPRDEPSGEEPEVPDARRATAGAGVAPARLARSGRAGAEPQLARGVMPATKARLNLLDMHRWAAHWNVRLTMPNAHPRRTVLAMRAILASGDVPRAAKELFRRYWRDGLDVSNPDVVADALDSAGFDGRAIVARAEDPAIKSALRAAVDEAATAGAFGVPTFVVHRPGADSELIWGQDRLHFVTAAIDGRLGAA